jgi:hypothetical protein
LPLFQKQLSTPSRRHIFSAAVVGATAVMLAAMVKHPHHQQRQLLNLRKRQ